MDPVMASSAAGAAGMLLEAILIPRYIVFARERGMTGGDVHKPGKPPVAEMGGVVLLLSALLVESLLYIAGVYGLDYFKAAFLATLVAGMIGVVDDLVRLNGIAKTVAGLVIGAPLLLFNAYEPRLAIPFIGSARFTILYPLAVPLAMSVFANAANMNDTHNGILHISAIHIYTVAGAAGALLLYCSDATGLALYMSLAFAPLSLGFLVYNMFPARVFNGDTGSLTVGTLIGLVAIMGKVEVAVVLAMMPWVIKGFGTIASVRGFKEKSEIAVKPVVIEGWEIRGSRDPRAPATLARLLTMDYSLTEPEVILAVTLLSMISSIVAVALSLVTYAGLG